MEMTYASRGVANAGLATGIVGAALGTLNAVGGLGAMALNGGRVAECNENQPINRYELDLVQKNAKLEAERRCCGDNSIVNYANATFYPKMVADVTTGTGTTAQTLYNPLPKCGECCNGN